MIWSSARRIKGSKVYMKIARNSLYFQIIFGLIIVFWPKLTNCSRPPFVSNPEILGWVLIFCGVNTLVILKREIRKLNAENKYGGKLRGQTK